MSESHSIVSAFRELRPGELAALATVVSVEGSSYRRAGARMLITESGRTTGALSGGGIERDVCKCAQTVMRTGQPVVVRYDIRDVLIEPATYESVAGVMQLLAECAEGEASGALATVFHVEGQVELTIGAKALLYPDGTVDGDFSDQSIFADLREATSSSVKRYEVSGGYMDVLLEVVQPRMTFVPEQVALSPLWQQQGQAAVSLKYAEGVR